MKLLGASIDSFKKEICELFIRDIHFKLVEHYKVDRSLFSFSF